MSLEDKDFSYWFNYFKQYKPSLNEFMAALDIKDSYYVNNDSQADFNDVLYEDVFQGGFIEGDFRKIMRASEGDDVDYYKTRIALFLYKGLDLKDLNKVLKADVIEEIIGDCLINGKYEEYGIEFHNIMSVIFKNKVCSIDSMMDWGFLYGTRLGEQYGEDFLNNANLKKLIIENKEELQGFSNNGVPEPENVVRLGNFGENEDTEDDE